MRFKLKIRKTQNFFEMLVKQAQFMTKGMRLLKEYCLTNKDEYADAVIATETEGDMARRELIDELNNTFITPIDREDLFKFSAQLDEILDYAKTTVDEIKLYGVTPDAEMVSVTAVLTQMCELTIIALQNMEHRPEIAKEKAIEVKKMENDVGEMTVKALAKLFDSADFRQIFKYREIYRHLNQTADIADTAMDLLLNILVKIQ